MKRCKILFEYQEKNITEKVPSKNLLSGDEFLLEQTDIFQLSNITTQSGVACTKSYFQFSTIVKPEASLLLKIYIFSNPYFYYKSCSSVIQDILTMYRKRILSFSILLKNLQPLMDVTRLMVRKYSFIDLDTQYWDIRRTINFF